MVFPVVCAAAVAVFVAGCGTRKLRKRRRLRSMELRVEQKGILMERQWSFHTACSYDSTNGHAWSLYSATRLSAIRSKSVDVIEPEAEPLGDALCTVSSEELRCAQQLRERMQLGGNLENAARWLEDGELLRYLRARSCGVAEAEDLLRRAVAWRARKARAWSASLAETGSFGAEHAAYLATAREGAATAAAPPDWWSFLHGHLHMDVYGEDRFGIPITYSNIGACDLEGCAREAGLDSLQRYLVYQNDFFLDRARSVSRVKAAATQQSVVLHGGIVILDMAGLGWRHHRGVKVLKEVSEVCKFLHPERQRRCFIVRTPRIFTMIWQLVTPMLDSRTREKIVILGAGESLQPLEEEVGRQYLPQGLGGLYAKLPRRPVGPVPEGALAELGSRRTAARR